MLDLDKAWHRSWNESHPKGFPIPLNSGEGWLIDERYSDWSQMIIVKQKRYNLIDISVDDLF